MSISTKRFAASLFRELEKEQFVEIDSYWFKMIADGDLTAEDDDEFIQAETENANALQRVLENAIKNLNM